MNLQDGSQLPLRYCKPWQREFIKLEPDQNENLFARIFKSICSNKIVNNVNNLIGRNCRKWRSRSLHRDSSGSRRKSEKVRYKRPKSHRQLRLAAARHPTSELAFHNAINEENLSTSCSSEELHTCYPKENKLLKNQTTIITCHKIPKSNINLAKYEETYPINCSEKLEKCTSEKLSIPNNNQTPDPLINIHGSSAIDLSDPVNNIIGGRENVSQKKVSDYNENDAELDKKNIYDISTAQIDNNCSCAVPKIQQIMISKPHMTLGQRVNKLVDSESCCSIKLVPKLSKSAHTGSLELNQAPLLLQQNVPIKDVKETLVRNADLNANYVQFVENSRNGEYEHTVDELCNNKDVKVGGGNLTEQKVEKASNAAHYQLIRPRSAPHGLSFSSAASEIDFELLFGEKDDDFEWLLGQNEDYELLPGENEDFELLSSENDEETPSVEQNKIESILATNSRVRINEVQPNVPIKSKRSHATREQEMSTTASATIITPKLPVKKSGRVNGLSADRQVPNKKKFQINRQRSTETNSLTKKVIPSSSYSKSAENVIPKRVSFDSKASLTIKSKTSSKILIKQIIDAISCGKLLDIEGMCAHLNKLSKTAPKLFSFYRNELMTAILLQVSSPQPKISIGAIRILRALYDMAPQYLFEEAERVIAKMLHKIGGTIYTDNICCEILEKVIEYSSPIRCALALSKVGTTLRNRTGRAASAKFLCDSITKMELLDDLGDSTPHQRRLTSLIFGLAVAFNRDTHLPTREYVKELFTILIKHTDFWKLYVENVKPAERSRVNRVLDEIQKTLRQQFNQFM